MIEIFDTKLNKKFYISVGKNATNNWDIIKKSAENDLWFHLDDKSSKHVILHMQSELPTDLNPATLLFCANKCQKNSSSSPVLIAFIRDIEFGETIGSVIVNKIYKKMKN
jgi:hypothetical protein